MVTLLYAIQIIIHHIKMLRKRGIYKFYKNSFANLQKSLILRKFTLTLFGLGFLGT